MKSKVAPTEPMICSSAPVPGVPSTEAEFCRRRPMYSFTFCQSRCSCSTSQSISSFTAASSWVGASPITRCSNSWRMRSRWISARTFVSRTVSSKNVSPRSRICNTMFSTALSRCSKARVISSVCAATCVSMFSTVRASSFSSSWRLAASPVYLIASRCITPSGVSSFSRVRPSSSSVRSR